MDMACRIRKEVTLCCIFLHVPSHVQACKEGGKRRTTRRENCAVSEQQKKTGICGVCVCV